MANKVEIYQEGNKVDVTIDGVKIQGVKYLEYKWWEDEPPSVLVEFRILNTEIEVNCND